MENAIKTDAAFLPFDGMILPFVALLDCALDQIGRRNDMQRDNWCPDR